MKIFEMWKFFFKEIIIDQAFKIFLSEKDIKNLSDFFKNKTVLKNKREGDKKNIFFRNIEDVNDYFLKIKNDFKIIKNDFFINFMQNKNYVNTFRKIMKVFIMTSCYGATILTNMKSLKTILNEKGFYFNNRILMKVTKSCINLIKLDLRKSFQIYDIFSEIVKIMGIYKKTIIWDNPFGSRFFFKVFKTSSLIKRISSLKKNKNIPYFTLGSLPSNPKNLQIKIRKMKNGLCANLIHSFDSAIMNLFYFYFDQEINNIYFEQNCNLIKDVDSMHDCFSTYIVSYYELKNALRKSYKEVIDYSQNYLIQFIELNLNNLKDVIEKDKLEKIKKELIGGKLI